MVRFPLETLDAFRSPITGLLGLLSVSVGQEEPGECTGGGP